MAEHNPGFPVETADLYMEWALLTGSAPARSKSRPAGGRRLPARSVQLIIECSEKLKDELQPPFDNRFLAEYAGVVFHEVADGADDNKIYSVSAHLDDVSRWRAQGKLKDVRVEYSTARDAPGEPDRERWLPPKASFIDAAQDASSAVEIGENGRLKGKVMVVIDDGLAFLNRAFRKADGNSTRVRYFWDQDPLRVAVFHDGEMKELDLGTSKAESSFSATKWREAPGFSYGRELAAAVIDELIAEAPDAQSEADAYRKLGYDRVRHVSAHGTHVADLAAGSLPPRHMGGKLDSAGADDTDIIMVQLPPSTALDTSGGGLAKHVLDALKYALSKVDDSAQVVVNLSFGATGGPHDGSSLFERALDSLIGRERSKGRNFALVLPAGNHFDAAVHAAGEIRPGAITELAWHVRAEDPTESFCELWFDASRLDDVCIELVKPNGDSIEARPGRTVFDGDMPTSSCCALGSVRHAAAANAKCAVLASLLPTHFESGTGVPAPSGMWKIKLAVGKDQKPVAFDARIQRDEATPYAPYRARQSYFSSTRPRLPSTADDVDEDPVKRRGTGNSVAHGRLPIVAGACYALSGRLSPYTAAGPTVVQGGRRCWPDLVAPGDLSEPMPGLLAAGTLSGSTVRMNGTSVAAPQVARAILNLFARKPALGGSHPGMDSASIVDQLLDDPNQGHRRPAGPGTQAPIMTARIGAGWLNVPCFTQAAPSAAAHEH
ncbi:MULTISPECIES: S8 family serine peptidase [unclassified Variovorax]|uniref:S8 family serine peptidase n=1 Tax=unclassified Variovorax TaxID=663243 RepID=UPI003ECFBB94